MAKKLLLIEDDRILLEMYKKLFRNHDYDVSTATDGENGLKKALKEHPDLTLLDIRMPKMDGMTLLKYLRQDSWGKDAKVIILTNLDATDNILKGVTKDYPSYYLIKSNTKPVEVLEYIKEVIGEQKNKVTE